MIHQTRDTYPGDRPFEPVTISPRATVPVERIATMMASFSAAGDADFVRGDSEHRVILGNVERYFSSYALATWLRRWRAKVCESDATPFQPSVTFGYTWGGRDHSDVIAAPLDAHPLTHRCKALDDHPDHQ